MDRVPKNCQPQFLIVIEAVCLLALIGAIVMIAWITVRGL